MADDDEQKDPVGIAEKEKSPKKKANRGYPPLETAMRSVYREARKFRSDKTELTHEEREKLECTFHPLLRTSPPDTRATTMARSRHQIFAGSGTKSMSTK